MTFILVDYNEIQKKKISALDIFESQVKRCLFNSNTQVSLT